MTLKFGKFQKKKIDEEVYILCKVKGKFPNKLAKQIKMRCNEAIQEVLHEETTESKE